VIRRQRQQVSLALSSPSVEDAIAAVQARRGQACREGLRLKTADNGMLTARIPGGRYSSPPRLQGFLRAGAGGVEFDGVISEAHASVGLPRGFVGMAAIFAVVTVLLAFGNPSPGSYVCGAGAVLFGLIGYVLGRLRRSSFRYDCKQLLARVTPLMPGASPHGEPGISRRLP